MIKYTEPYYENYSDKCARLFPSLFSKADQILTLTFQVTEDCCMACTYCYQNNKSPNKMSFDTAKKVIDNLLTDDNCYDTADKNALILEFIGGEPLMEIDLISEISDYFITKCIELNHRFLEFFMISISSNGLLYFEPKVQEFIKKHHRHLSYSVSVDGNKELHDACRVDLDGNGTYDRAIAAELHYHQTYGRSLETKMTLSPFNISHTFEALQNLINVGYKSISLNCVYEEGWEISHATILYRELKKFADWIFENNEFRKYRVSMFNKDLFKPMSDEETSNWCGGVCNGMLSFDYAGKAFPCIRYMGSSLNGKQVPYSIGTIDGLFQTEEECEKRDLLMSITRQSQSDEECLTCPVATGCGWCSGYNYECFGTPNKRAKFTCWMHRARALANAYYWNKGFHLLEEKEKFNIHIPEEIALQIISKEEWEEIKYYE